MESQDIESQDLESQDLESQDLESQDLNQALRDPSRNRKFTHRQVSKRERRVNHKRERQAKMRGRGRISKVPRRKRRKEKLRG